MKKNKKGCHPEFVSRSYEPRYNKKVGFTLAETLITLTILGVVAAITIPTLINKYIEATNRTKVKKAMAAYEKALNQMIVENDLKDGAAIQAFGSTIDGVACKNTRPYFKAIEGIANNNCRFKTADRVWWDITDIQHPIIALNDDYKNATLLGDDADTLEALAKSSDNNEVFGMVGTIDNGVVRINDKGATTDTDDAALLSNMYSFINPENVKTNNISLTVAEKINQCKENVSEICDTGNVKYKKISLSGEVGYAGLVSDDVSWNAAMELCNPGTHLATETEIMQMWDSEALDTLCDTCNRNQSPIFWVNSSSYYEETEGSFASAFDTLDGMMGSFDPKSRFIKAVCVSD